LSTTTRYHPEGESTDQPAAIQKKALDESFTPYSRDVNKTLPVEGNLGERLIFLIKSYEKFDQVSHNQWDPDRVPASDKDGNPSLTEGQGFGSFEDVHNTVHDLVGGEGEDSQKQKRDGHMSHIFISAFDPIFWLHHT
jgi:tyrosinase